jgi:hypothetical protein
MNERCTHCSYKFQSVYYNNKMVSLVSLDIATYEHNICILQNPGVAIFTLIGSQLLGYGFAGLLSDILVKPTKCFWPANSKPYHLSCQSFFAENML